MTYIQCCICKEQFEEMFPDSNQAYGCSCTADKQGVTGHYGSTVIDMQRWIWKYGCHPSVISSKSKEPVICDSCIKNIIGEGLIELKYKSGML